MCYAISNNSWRHLNFITAACLTSFWSKENELFARSEGWLISVHFGRRALPHLGRLHPLLPCAQSLLEGPSAQDESLWSQHTHNVGSLCDSITGLQLLCSHIKGGKRRLNLNKCVLSLGILTLNSTRLKLMHQYCFPKCFMLFTFAQICGMECAWAWEGNVCLPGSARPQVQIQGPSALEFFSPP